MSTSQEHAHHAHDHAHDHAHAHGESPADLLDLDAEVVGHLDDLTGWAAGHTTSPPRAVVDVGAGTGTGTLALARRFPAARLVALDRSADMLERTLRAARAHDVEDRLQVVQADLDAGWPSIGAVDLAWAASSLHHLAEADRVLTDLHGALAPGGLLVVVEMDGMPRLLPSDVGVGRPGLEERCRTAMAQDSWNAHPDWAPHLERAGFELLEQRTWDYVRDPAAPAANRYAHEVYSRVRAGLAHRLDAEDVATLDRLLADGAPESLLRRGDLVVRSTRTTWAARRA